MIRIIKNATLVGVKNLDIWAEYRVKHPKTKLEPFPFEKLKIDPSNKLQMFLIGLAIGIILVVIMMIKGL